MKNKVYTIAKNLNFPIITVILAALIGVNILFIKPIVGMANNGDYFRIISSNNLYYLRDTKNQEPLYFKYFQPKYGVSDLYNTNQKMIVSTQSLLIKPAMLLDKLITGNDKTFDLRYLAIILLGFQLLATYFIMKVFCSYLKSPLSKAIISFLYLFVFMDVGYIAYFNSFFGEGVNIPFFLLSVGFLLYIIRFNKVKWYNILIFSIVSIIFFGAKQQLAPVGVLLAILLFRVMYYKRSMEIKVVSITCAIILTFAGIYFYSAIKGDFQYINKYHALNRGILLNEKNPDEILKSMGISTQYSLLENTIYFSPVTQINLNDKKLIKEYYDKIGVGNIIKFYALHPNIMIKMMDLGFREGYDIRPNELGNYTVASGKPPVAKSYFWGGWSYIKAKFFPKSLLASLIYISIFLYFSIKRYKKGNDKEKLVEEVYYYVLLVGISQIAISLIGAGDADLAKHEFMYNMAFDFLFLVCINNVLIKLEKRGDK
ncbi:MAG: hypothetical protein ACRC28_11535 [Clostridium sp.]|uniref:glycan biosynthesis hexose transferase WsfD n=1 Tax=Clostridium sp. TaxID=1506 RepID=UPI003F2AA42F